MPARRTGVDVIVCKGLVVEIGPSDLTAKVAFDRALEAVADRLPGEWGVEPLSWRGHDFLVTRWSGKPIAVGRAWEFATRLAESRHVRTAEPAFRGAGLEPEAAQAAELLAPHELTRSRSFFGGSRPLPGARDSLWSLKLIGAQAAWAMRPPRGGKQFGEGIVVGHPDTGYTRHPEIWESAASRRRLLTGKGFDFEDDRPDPRDPLDGQAPGHGTSTASVIMSDHVAGGDEAAVSGVAPAARLIPFRVSDSVIHIDFANVAKAIEASVEAGAHVISMSLGGPFPSGFLERTIDRALEAGVIVLAAAGNYWPWVVYPARLDQVVAVAAVNCERKPWKHSARGGSVDVAAPGESVWRAQTTREDGARHFVVAPSSGTSYAVATTAGACALWLGFHGRENLIQRYGKPNLAAVFRELMVRDAVQRPPRWKSDKYGAGILRVDRLLAAELPEGPPAGGLKRTLGRGLRPGLQPLERIGDYLPGVKATQLRAALAEVLRVPGDDLDELLAEHGDEIVFQIATDPVLRGALYDAANPRRARSLRRGPTRRVKRPQNLSRALRKRMHLGR